MNSALALKNIYKGFGQGHARVEVLQNVSLTLHPGEAVALLGPSGSGKSTLLHIAGLLAGADRGEVLIDDVPAGSLADEAKTELRLNKMGFVYQSHHLLPDFTALENVMLPQLLRGTGKRAAQERAASLLESVGLAKVMRQKPVALSGGERQRVCIARALANAPQIILADEPTGSLDPQTAQLVVDHLLRLTSSHHAAVLMVTHDQMLAKKASRIIDMKNFMPKNILK